MGRATSLLILLVSSSVAGCLSNPSLGHVDAQSPVPDSGGDEDAVAPMTCETCTAGEGRCVAEGDGTAYEICSADRDGDDCRSWQRADLCSAAQTCSATAGCECPAPCDLDGEFDCSGTPRLCVEVDGCPTWINACRPPACGAAIADAAFCARPENDGNALCEPCRGDDGRDCVPACPGTLCYTCGALGVP